VVADLESSFGGGPTRVEGGNENLIFYKLNGTANAAIGTGLEQANIVDLGLGILDGIRVQLAQHPFNGTAHSLFRTDLIDILGLHLAQYVGEDFQLFAGFKRIAFGGAHH